MSDHGARLLDALYRAAGVRLSARQIDDILTAVAAETSRLPGELLGAALLFQEALGLATHGYVAPPGDSTGCDWLVPAVEAVVPGQVCTLPAAHPRHQTPDMVLGRWGRTRG